MRKWSHSRTSIGAMLSLDQLMEDAPDSITSESAPFEEEIIESQTFEAFAATLSERDRQILQFKADGLTPRRTKFETDRDILRGNIRAALPAAKSFESVIKEKKELRRQIQIYRKAAPLYEEYKQIKRKSRQEDFYRAHESDFILRESALRYFKNHDIKKLPAVI